MPHDSRSQPRCQGLQVSAPGGIPGLHLRFERPANVLDLGIAGLKTIDDPEFRRISGGLSHHAFEHAKLEGDYQSRVARFQFPNATKIWRDDFKITVNSRSSVPFAATAAVNGNRRPNMDGNHHSR